MNERIQKLAEQAGVTLSSFQFSGTPSKYEVAEHGLEKFAELIVKECVQACVDQGRTFEVESAGEYSSRLYASAIKRHFGVEE